MSARHTGQGQSRGSRPGWPVQPSQASPPQLGQPTQLGDQFASALPDRDRADERHGLAIRQLGYHIVPLLEVGVGLGARARLALDRSDLRSHELSAAAPEAEPAAFRPPNPVGKGKFARGQASLPGSCPKNRRKLYPEAPGEPVAQPERDGPAGVDANRRGEQGEVSAMRREALGWLPLRLVVCSYRLSPSSVAVTG